MAAKKHDPEGSHLSSPTLLRKIDELREKNVGQHVPLPQLVVVGDQSSGKSSLLESLTKIPFPRDLELCTRYATQITSRRDFEARVTITIIPGPNAADEHKNRLEEYRPQQLAPKDFRARFPEILKEVNTKMQIRTDTSSTEGNVFSEDILKIEICGPEEDYLTLIDVPGIFRTPTEGITTKKDIALVHAMVRRYIQDSRTIILAVLPSNVDPATQEILTLAEDYDKAGERTLGVLTKPDLVKEASAKTSVCNVVLGKRKPLTLGYYVIRNRGADDDDNFDSDSGEAMFQEQPWNGLPKERLGVLALKTRLGELLGQIARREFPLLRKDVKKQLTECETQLEGLGPARETEQEQRLFLSSMSRQFQDLVHSALHAHYFSHPVFEAKQELRLITHVVNLTERFNREFLEKGQLMYFESVVDGSVEEDLNNHANETKEENKPVVDATAEPEWINNALTDPALDNIVSQDYDFQFPESGIMDWIDKLYQQYRGIEMGTFGGAILSSAFKEQSRKWEGMAKAFVSKVIGVIQRFITTALEMLCPDPRVHEEVWLSIVEEVLSRYRRAIDQATFLVSIQRNQPPYTLNSYFNEKLQILRGRRIAALLKGKARQEEIKHRFGECGTTRNLIVDLDAVKQATVSQDNAEHIRSEIHDILWSFYQVAETRFVDSVHSQAVFHFLLTGSLSPLAVFSQEWVIELDADQLEAIAGESPATRARRMALKNKIDDLKVAMRILAY